MKIHLYPAPGPATLTSFADQHGLEMEVREREFFPIGSHGRFFAGFRNVWVVDGRMLAGCYGDGADIDSSIDAYMHAISGKVIRFKDQDIRVPRLSSVE